MTEPSKTLSEYPFPTEPGAIHRVLPSVSATISRIKVSGWEKSSEGTLGAFWTRGNTRVAVPHDWSGDPGLAKSTLSRLAEVEELDFETFVDEVQRIAELERENRELRRANDILKAADLPRRSAPGHAGRCREDRR